MDLRGAIAALATSHGKDEVIAPALATLGIEVRVAAVETDRFGTFAGDVPRLSTPLATAIAKARAGLAAMPDAELALASEGTFRPRPDAPFVDVDHELVVLLHRTSRLRLVGEAWSGVSRIGGPATTVEEALANAERLGFPRWGVILMRAEGGRPAPRDVVRDLATLDELRAGATRLLRSGGLWVEPDRRAHRDPDRMRVIAAATADLVDQLQRACPACRAPGYAITGQQAGLACEECGGPTPRRAVETRTCWACRRSEDILVHGRAPIAECSQCHP